MTTFDQCINLCNTFCKYLPDYLYKRNYKEDKIELIKFEIDGRQRGVDALIDIKNQTIQIKNFNDNSTVIITADEFLPRLEQYFKRKELLIKEALFEEFKNEIKNERYKKLIDSIEKTNENTSKQ